MRSQGRWSTVEQLVLVESMENYYNVEQNEFWTSVSYCVIKTLQMISNINTARFSAEQCSYEWEELKKDYENQLSRDYTALQTINYCLRKKRIDELDREMNNVKNKLLRLQETPTY